MIFLPKSLQSGKKRKPQTFPPTGFARKKHAISKGKAPKVRVTVWTAEKQSEGTPEQGSVSVGIESAATLDTDKELSPFAQRVELRRRGFHDAERRVVLGDGALWIWNIADELFPDAIQILFHTKQHLWSKAKEIYGDGNLAEA